MVFNYSQSQKDLTHTVFTVKYQYVIASCVYNLKRVFKNVYKQLTIWDVDIIKYVRDKYMQATQHGSRRVQNLNGGKMQNAGCMSCMSCKSCMSCMSCIYGFLDSVS